jgi:ribonuclease P protein component
MLGRTNRLVRGEDFRRIMRSGKKLSTKHLVGYQLLESSLPQRFGFVVSKASGGAVKRNLLKRRLRSLVRTNMASFPAGSQVVLRTLPGSAELDFQGLSADFEQVCGLK